MPRAASSSLKTSIAQSPELQKLRKKRRSRRTRLLVLLSILLLTILGGLVYIARYPRFQIQSVTVVGNQVTDTSDIVAHVDADLSGSYAYVFPRRNIFIYPKHVIAADLARTFPRLRNIAIERQNLRTLVITVTEVRGIALWCGPVTDPLDYTAPCYFTDDTGAIVSLAPEYSGNVYLRFFGGAASANPLGTHFIPEANFHALSNFATSVRALGFPVKAIRIGPAEENAMILDLGGGNTALIRFLAASDYTVLSGNLAAALSKKELSGTLAKERANLQYFDLRFTNKVYY